MIAELLLSALHVLAAGAYEHGPEEYCNMKEFRANCSDGHVIMMKSARYGRMSIGKCIKQKYYIGCVVDVTKYMHQKCSGRVHCSMKVPDENLHAAKPCPDDFTSYLQASYSCIKVSSSGGCGRGHVLRASSGLLSSESDGVSGSLRCPWQIELEPGQSVNLTLISFVNKAAYAPQVELTGDRSRHDACYEVAEVNEPSRSSQSITLCHGDRHERSVFVSRKHTLSVHLLNRKLLSELGAFLFKYEAVGCPTMRAQQGTYTLRQEGSDSLEVRCNRTKTAWHLTCRGTKWVGHFGNCSHRVRGWRIEQWFTQGDEFPYGIILVVAIGVALGILVGGILLTCVIVYTKRQRRESANKQVLSNKHAEEPEDEWPCPPSPYAQYQQHSTPYHQATHESIVIANGAGETRCHALYPPQQHIYEIPHPP